MMKAMILAAGKGTRVQPLTHEMPKPMIPILGKPVMAYIVEHLARHGVREIMVNVAHLHEKIQEYFGDGHQYGVEIGYSFEGYCDDQGNTVPLPLGSAGGMKKIQEFGGFFDESTIVLCGDAIIDLDITAALAQHRRHRALATVVTKEVPWNKVQNYGIVISDSEKRVISFQEKPERSKALSTHASTGIYIFEPEVMGLIPSGKSFDIGADLFPLLVQKGLSFYEYASACNWFDIGTVTDYWAVHREVMQRNADGRQLSGKKIAEGVWAGLNVNIDWHGTSIQGPVYLGSGTRIESGVSITGPTWIGAGSRVMQGAKISESVLFEYTRISPQANIKDSIVFRSYSLDRHGNIMHQDESDKSWGNARDRRLTTRT